MWAAEHPKIRQGKALRIRAVKQCTKVENFMRCQSSKGFSPLLLYVLLPAHLDSKSLYKLTSRLWELLRESLEVSTMCSSYLVRFLPNKLQTLNKTDVILIVDELHVCDVGTRESSSFAQEIHDGNSIASK